MSNDDSQAASQALYELAQWVDRDQVDSAHLEAYMCKLLDRLIEVHATCRLVAIIIARAPEYLSAEELAVHLRELAFALEQVCPVITARPSGQLLLKAIAFDRSIDLLPGQQNLDSPPEQYRWKWFPELCAALLFGAAGISLMFLSHADHALRLMAAALYLGVGIAYAGASIRLAWSKAH